MTDTWKGRSLTGKNNTSVEKPVEAQKQSEWAGIIRATGSPLKLFALIVLVCNSIFGIAAAWNYPSEIFIFTLHTFLAIVACFVLIALWSPRSFYSPSELTSMAEFENRQKGQLILPKAQPLVPTLIIAVFVLIYAYYQNTNG